MMESSRGARLGRAALGLLAAGGFWVGVNFAVAALLTVAAAARLMAASTWLLAHGTYPPTGRSCLPCSSRPAATPYEASLELRERRRLRRAFGACVSPDYVQILRSDPPPGLGGERDSLCVLFSDIRGFTRQRAVARRRTIACSTPTTEVPCHHGDGGTLDKFIGDGIMAFFGAPQRLDTLHAGDDAMREMLERLARLNAALPRRRGAGRDRHRCPRRRGGGGRHGLRNRHEYTAIGDTVNVASRIEGLTKDVDFPLARSERVFENLKDRSGFVKPGPRPIEGHQPAVVYGGGRASHSPSDTNTETT